MKLEPQKQFNLPDGMIAIKATWLKRLVSSQNEMNALDGAGVDNWSGYEVVDWENVERRNERHQLLIDQALAS